jgi:hypothetical protein
MKYWRLGAVGLTAGMILAIGGGGAALAADPPTDVVADGVVTVHWVDTDDGPIGHAPIRITYYHAGDVVHGIMPAAFTDSDGNVVITDVPRAAEGSAALLLDVRGDLSTRTVDEAGCATIASWLAESDGVTSAATLEISLETSSKSMTVNCPEPDPSGDPAPGGDPSASAEPQPSGGVLGATGRPQITLPPTDVAVVTDGDGSGTPVLPALLLVLAASAIVLPLRARATAAAERRRR